jgi:hypothetical protein
MTVHACNPSPHYAGVGGWGVQVQPGYIARLCLKNRQTPQPLITSHNGMGIWDQVK